MQKLFSLALVGSALLVLAGCNSQTDDTAREAEIEQRVEARMRQERLNDLERQLEDKALDLSDREALLTEQQRLLEEQRIAVEVAKNKPAPAPRVKETKEPEGKLYTGGPGGDYEYEQDVPPARRVSYNRFYEDLQLHGDWYETQDYGYVYQPSRIGNNWAPYTEGQWVYSDYGWTFVSEEPHSWATYHYGRWIRLRGRGWCWVPGDEWAPAWVSWRTGDDYVGWAPLPPEARFDRSRGISVRVDVSFDIGPDYYNFVNVRNFGDRRIRQGLLPRERNVVLIRNTRNVTNITYRNRSVVNEGPNFEQMRGRTARPIERVRVERQSRGPRERERGSRLDNNVLTLAAPVFTEEADRKRERPKNVKSDEGKVEADRGWSRAEKEGKSRELRQQMKREAEQAATPALVEAAPEPEATPVAVPAEPENAPATKPVEAESEATPRQRRERAGERRSRKEEATPTPAPEAASPQVTPAPEDTPEMETAPVMEAAPEMETTPAPKNEEKKAKGDEEGRAAARAERQAERQREKANNDESEALKIQAAQQAEAQRDEAAQAQAEQQRQQAEAQRQEAMQTQAEAQRQQAEAQRQQAEERQAQAAQQRQEAEAQREEARQAQAEARRQQAEAQRQEADQRQAEAMQAQAEQRQQAEAQRQEAEQRQAEAIQAQAEQQRQQAEAQQAAQEAQAAAQAQQQEAPPQDAPQVTDPEQPQ